MRLTEAQYRYLKSLGHDLSPVVSIGAGGLTSSVIKQIDDALSREELVKVRVPFGDRQRRNSLMGTLAPQADAVLIHRVGNAALLYRPAKKPIIRLPQHSS